jgi:hypothetical protein
MGRLAVSRPSASVAIIAAALFGSSLAPQRAHAGANLIPDHTFRLGSCGAGGVECDWLRGVGGACNVTCSDPMCTTDHFTDCPGTTACTLDVGMAFPAALEVTFDDVPCPVDAGTPCVGGKGTVLTIGIAGTGPGGPFQLTDKVLDLCNRNMVCTGRDPHICPVCSTPADATCTGALGDPECPPGDVVFMCKDPCVSPTDPCFNAGDIAGSNSLLLQLLKDTQTPLLDLIRADLAAVFPGATGLPVILDAKEETVATGTPPKARFCVTVGFLREDKPLGVCSNDAKVFCDDNADCGAGTCGTGMPADVNPAAFTTTVSGRVCDVNGKPCVVNTDCPSGSCSDTAATAVMGTCPTTVCGSVAMPAPQGISCDVDQNACTRDECNGAGTCLAVASITTCLNGDGCCPAGCTAANDNDCTGCPPAPLGTCQSTFGQASLVVNDKKVGKEKVIAKWSKGPLLDGTDFGDPVGGQTAYTLCVYDNNDALKATYVVDRAGATCGTDPCWKGLGKPPGFKGFKYKDKARTSDGIQLVLLKAAEADKSKVVVKGKGANLPDGVAAALQGATGATIQLIGSDAPECISATLSTVKDADGVKFKAQ